MRYYFFLFFILLTFATSAFASEKLIIEPEMGRSPILSAINNAKKSVDLVMYGFTDNSMLQAFIDAKKNGKNVQVLLEPHPYKAVDENNAARQQLRIAHIPLLASNPNLRLTHQKTLITDHQQAFIMTFNFTHGTFTKERNFALVIDDPAMLQEIETVFQADADHQVVTVENPNLVWSPNNSREKILHLIKSAKKNISIYAQDISDYQTIGEISHAARGGVQVNVLLPQTKGNTSNKKINFLKKSGVDVRYSKNYIIHAKVMIIDDKRAMVGSINLTRNSLNHNRELAIITADPDVLQQLTTTFSQDWANTLFSHTNTRWHKPLSSLPSTHAIISQSKDIAKIFQKHLLN